MTTPRFFARASLLLYAFFAPSLLSAQVFWGATGSDPIGGTGIWNTTDTRWSSAESGGTYAA